MHSERDIALHSRARGAGRIECDAVGKNPRTLFAVRSDTDGAQNGPTRARSVGVGEFSIATRHVLPLVISPILVQTALTLSHTIFTVTALSFLGIGPPPPDPNWGSMLSEARQFMELAPLTVVGPAMAIVFATLTFIVLANGLREILDVGSR